MVEWAWSSSDMGEGVGDWVIVMKVRLSPRCRWGGILLFFHTSGDGVYDHLSMCCDVWLEIQLTEFGK